MSQNIYDDEGFFAAYARLRRSVEGLAAAGEWPVLQGLLGPVAGARVLDLGCGYGWFCRWALGSGAAAVSGVDLSERMLARAREAGGGISYAIGDLEDLTIAAGAWDVVYSSLALHYVVGIGGLFRRVFDGLAPGGRLVFSVEHPIFTAPKNAAWRDGVWPLDSYLVEGPRVTDWLAPGVIKQHRTVGTYVEALLAAGFRLTGLVEWGPSAAQVAENPAWALERERPPFLLVSAVRD